MGKKETKFRFKCFSAEHCGSSMKIGVDAVTLGSWTEIPQSGAILDVGTGCGVIALMCAQRSSDSMIHAIDIDPASVSEARGNFEASPWNERLYAECVDFFEFIRDNETKYSLIISNPPYFESGVDPESSIRMCARHKGSLSPETILEAGIKLLDEKGSIAMVVPADQRELLLDIGKSLSLFPYRQMLLRGRPELPPKRYFVQLRLCACQETAFPDIIDIEMSPGIFSPRYKELGRDFYLSF